MKLKSMQLGIFSHKLYHQSVSAAACGSEPVLTGTKKIRSALTASPGATLTHLPTVGVQPCTITVLDSDTAGWEAGSTPSWGLASVVGGTKQVVTELFG